MPQPAPRVALVTGAGGALGRAFCCALARRGGWHVVATDLDERAAVDALAAARTAGLSAGEACQLDVTDAAAWRELRERLQAQHPRLDLLVNNAGICMAAEVGDGELADWDRVWQVNYRGVLLGCHTMAPWLKATAAARPIGAPAPAVINIASIAAAMAAPAMGAYSASKAAVVALSETMHSELRPLGVHVAVAAPGFFASQLLERGVFPRRRHRLQAEKLMRRAQIDADRVAAAALAAAQRGALYVVVGRRARWLWRLERWAPTTLHRLIGRTYRRQLRDDEGAADDPLPAPAGAARPWAD